MRIRASIAAVSFIPSLASAAPPIHLAPSSPWIVDYAENSCRLIRAFGEGESRTLVALESEAPGAVDMVVTGMPLATSNTFVRAKFLPERSKPMEGIVAVSDKGTPSVLVTNLNLLSNEALESLSKSIADQVGRRPVTDLAWQAATRSARQAFADGTIAIEIDPRRNHPIVLDTGSFGEAIRTFEKCSRDSLRDWGVDPDLEDKIVRRPYAAHPQYWFSEKDYPREMVARMHESVVKVRLLVDATGHVTKCTSLSHFNETEFNRITCAGFTKRARFEPAELADGTKVPSYYVNTVIFRLVR